jgi:hypothetical protein
MMEDTPMMAQDIRYNWLAPKPPPDPNCTRCFQPKKCTLNGCASKHLKPQKDER